MTRGELAEDPNGHVANCAGPIGRAARLFDGPPLSSRRALRVPCWPFLGFCRGTAALAAFSSSQTNVLGTLDGSILERLLGLREQGRWG